MAKYYAQGGWKILPVYGIGPDGLCTCGKQHTDPKDRGKHPAVSNWQNDASSDPAQIDTWWRQDARYNVGVYCKSSGFLVVDIDPRSGGFETMDKLEESTDWQAITPTVEAMTGVYDRNGQIVRGRHLFYKVDPTDSFIGKLEAYNKNFKGVDIKHNGYVLLTPSNHLSGNQYEWKPGHAPWEMDMAEPSPALMDIIRKGSKRRSALGSKSSKEWEFVNDLEWRGKKLDIDRFLDEGIDEGARAVDIYAMSCAIANQYDMDKAMDKKNVETMMIRFNHEQVRPPLDQDELMKHVHNAMTYVQEHPKLEVIPGGAEALAYISSGGSAERKQLETWQPSSPASREVVRQGVHFESTSDPDDDMPYAQDTDRGLGMQVTEIAFSGRKIGHVPLNVPKDPDALSGEEGADPARRSLSDLGNGRRVVDSFNSVIRYTPGLGWFNWQGNFWEPDSENLRTRELTKKLSSVIAREVVNYEDTSKQTEVIKWANKAKSNGAQSSALESATSDPRVLVGVEDWDSDENLLGVQNGVVNLKTGELLRGQPNLYITRKAPVSYTPGIKDKRWEAFLDFATNGDKEYQAWLQRAVGYTLTGSRAHDVMFLVYGPGGSGKNVLVEAIVKAMGTNQYAWPMDSQILAQGDGQAHGADLYHWAELRGRRMVWVDELPESERLKENSVKKLTGSSEISARSPGEKPFTFSARAKLWVTTNHRPIISDDAMWRRIRPIPWMNVPAIPDPTLKEYIFDPEGGLPGVLAWAVEGAMVMLNSKEIDSLGWCKVVAEAAEVYRANEDRIGMFLNEETTETMGEQISIKSLFTVYSGWSFDRGEKGLSQIAFTRKLMDRGCTIVGTGGRAILENYALRPRIPSSSETDWNSFVGAAR